MYLVIHLERRASIWILDNHRVRATWRSPDRRMYPVRKTRAITVPELQSTVLVTVVNCEEDGFQRFVANTGIAVPPLHAQRQHGTTWYGTPLGPECEDVLRKSIVRAIKARG